MTPPRKHHSIWISSISAPPPPDPDEGGVDWDALLVTAQTIDANLASVGMALDAAQSELAALQAELEGYKSAA